VWRRGARRRASIQGAAICRPRRQLFAPPLSVFLCVQCKLSAEINVLIIFHYPLLTDVNSVFIPCSAAFITPLSVAARRAVADFQTHHDPHHANCAKMKITSWQSV
jgi:hypothetical protein